jgi:hypothetical protein
LQQEREELNLLTKTVWQPIEQIVNVPVTFPDGVKTSTKFSCTSYEIDAEKCDQLQESLDMHVVKHFDHGMAGEYLRKQLSADIIQHINDTMVSFEPPLSISGHS